jgi:hypothetical protein
MRHQVQWTAPAPFWAGVPDRSDAARLSMRRPALLRFASDAFMDEFNLTLETNPPKLRDLEAKYETWKEPVGSSAVVAAPRQPKASLEKKLARLKLSADRRLARLSGATSTALLEPDQTTTVTRKPLKLYQPAHQRYYLVSAALVCRLPGLPDRTINATHQEKAAFVLRRVRTVVDGGSTVTKEYGFVPGGTAGTWVPIANPDLQLADGEERLPLFSVNFHDDEGLRRRVLAGLIPAGKRESYIGASEAQGPPPDQVGELGPELLEPGAPSAPVDPRIALLTAEVIEPWKTLVAQADRLYRQIVHPENVGHDTELLIARRDARETLQVGSWYILHDFGRFLAKHLKDVWDALPNSSDAGLDEPIKKVWNALNVTLPPGIQTAINDSQMGPSMTVKTSLRDVLRTLYLSHSDQLEAAADRFDRLTPSRPRPDGEREWPNFLFPLVDLPVITEVIGDQIRGIVNGVLPDTPPTGTSSLQTALRKISALRDLIADALPETPTDHVPELPLAAHPIMRPDERAMFVVRCVLERPDCVQLPVLSAPSEAFEIAGFFDPDAPARPIRIALPMDTSPAGLRRAPKNAAFMMSDMLCGQVNKAKSMGFIDLVLSVLPFPFHKGLSGGSSACKDPTLSIGMVCSLSIPIITICALIILIIMVTLLDMIFKWLPYFFFCFPLPKFSGKPKEAT